MATTNPSPNAKATGAEPSLTKPSARGPSTTAVHAGESRDKPANAITDGIFCASTYTFPDTQAIIDYIEQKQAREEYGRYGNPARASSSKSWPRWKAASKPCCSPAAWRHRRLALGRAEVGRRSRVFSTSATTAPASTVHSTSVNSTLSRSRSRRATTTPWRPPLHPDTAAGQRIADQPHLSIVDLDASPTSGAAMAWRR